MLIHFDGTSTCVFREVLELHPIPSVRNPCRETDIEVIRTGRTHAEASSQPFANHVVRHIKAVRADQ